MRAPGRSDSHAAARSGFMWRGWSRSKQAVYVCLIGVRHARSTSPLAGEVDRVALAKRSGGGSWFVRRREITERGTPLPNPPPQGGRGHTAFAERAVVDLEREAMDLEGPGTKSLSAPRARSADLARRVALLAPHTRFTSPTRARASAPRVQAFSGEVDCFALAKRSGGG